MKGRINEDTPWDPTVEKTPYAYSKYGAELEIWRASQEGIPVAIVNPGVILGQGMPRNPLAQLVEQIEKGLSFYPTCFEILGRRKVKNISISITFFKSIRNI